MRMKEYPNYKKTSVEWLGDIPEHWDIVKMKYAVNLINEKNDDSDLYQSYIGLENIESGTGKFRGEVDNIQHDGQATIFRRGDVLFGKLRPYLAKAFCANFDGICSGEFLIFRPKAVSENFLLNYILNPNFIGIVNSSTYGVKMPRASWEYIGNLPILIPPQEEQGKITRFIDCRTSHIDSLLEKKRNQIDILKEKRTALISHAITKGLDPNMLMKDSGIGWLGKIPEHWEIRRLKYCASINNEVLSETTDSDFEFDYVDIGNVDATKGIMSTETHRFEDAPSRARRIVREGDTIVSTVRTYLRAIASIRKLEGKLIVSTGFAVIRPHLLNPIYMSYALQSPFFVETIVSRSTGVSYPAINASEIGNIFITIPPNDEQQAIADFLTRETGRIDSLIEKIERSIEILKEYRTSLISSAVTGKRDVRGEVS